MTKPARCSVRFRTCHLLGARPYDDVPAYLQHADVVIVPHVVSPFTESLDPIKAYECVAVGRPTVATPVAGFRGLGGAIAAVDRDRFVETVHETLANPRPSGPRAAASWTERARAFRGRVGQNAGSAVTTPIALLAIRGGDFGDAGARDRSDGHGSHAP